MLRHAVTLTFDPLTLKVCCRSGVTWSLSVVSLIEIEQSPAELFIIWQISALLRHAVTLTFDPLTLNIYGRCRVICSIYVPNLSEIDQCAPELLTINDRFFVRF